MSVKAEVRLSEIRSRFLELAEAEPGAETTAEINRLRDEHTHLEAQVQASKLAETRAQTVEEVATPDGLGELRSRVRLTEFIRAVQAGQDVHPGSAEAEYRSELLGNANGQAGPVVPIDILNTEERAATTVTVSGISGEVNYQTPWLDRVFNTPVSAMLGVQPTMVPEGQAASILMTAGSAPAMRAEGAASPADSMTFTATTLTPKRLGGHAQITLEALAQNSDSLEMAIRRDMASAIADKMEELILVGSGTGNDPQGITQAVGTITNPAASANFASFTDATAIAAEFIDGQYASEVSDISLVVHPTIYENLYKTRSTDGNKYVAGELKAMGTMVRASAHMPAPDTTTNSGKSIYLSIAKIGSHPGSTFTPVWRAMELIRDNMSGAAEGIVKVTANTLWFFRVVRTDSFKGWKWQITT